MPPAIEVPALPTAYVQALHLMREADADVERVTSVAESDAAFTGALLRLANSAESAPLSPIRTPRMAIVRLGLGNARRAIFGVTLQQAFRGSDGSRVDDVELWRHLVAVGLIADNLAWGEVKYTDAFTTGLLHDVGRLAMASQDARRYAAVVELTRRGEDVRESERRAFGFDHVECGTDIVRQWGFPHDMVQAIADHHDGESGGLPWVIARAREHAWSLGIGDGVVAFQGNPLEPGMEAPPVVEELGGVETVLAQVARFQSAVRNPA